MPALHHEERDGPVERLAIAQDPLELGVHRVFVVAADRTTDSGGHEFEHTAPGVAHRAAAARRPRSRARTCRVPVRRGRRDVRPSARSRRRARPRSTPRARSLVMASRSAALASSWARSRMTYARNAACGTCVPTSSARGKRSSASRYSGNVSQSQRIPSASALPGMSSTPSISSMSHSRRSAAHGREADAAVAEDRGGHAVPARRGQVRVPCGLPVEVGVHVDEAGRDEQPVRVDGAPAARVDRADRDDHAIVDGDIGPARRARRCRPRRCRHGSRDRASGDSGAVPRRAHPGVRNARA